MNSTDFIKKLQTLLKDKNKELWNANQAIIALRARRSLVVKLIMCLLDEGELAGSDWDYIAESEVEDIDKAINELKEKAFIAGLVYADQLQSESDILAAKAYAKHRPWHDS